MASRARYDAGAAALDVFSRYMMRKSDQYHEDKRAIAQEEAAIVREEAAAERQERRRSKRVTGNSGPYRGVGVGPDGPSQDVALVDLTNDAGEVVSRRNASQREASDYDTRQQALAAQTQFDQEEFGRKQEDRLLDRKVKETGMTNQSRRASAQEERARRTGMTEDKPEKPLTRNEALKALSSFRYRAQEGESARAVAERDGVDYDSLLEAANRGVEKKPGVMERVGNAVGGAFSSIADKFLPKEGKSIMAQREPGKKAAPKKDDGSHGVIKAGYIDRDEGMRFLGGNPNDPKNWEPVK